jgi:BirA family biotin operon repressor/biotin-[acetyl-CoA-carboxylase] ligase
MDSALDLHPALIGRLCKGGRIGHTVICLDTVDSTNTAAARFASAGAGEGTVIVAARQVAGKGRMGRSWFSNPSGSLVFSVILRPARSGETLTALLALSAVRILDRSCSDVSVKWPNDIWIGGRKIAGILAEARRDSVVLGMGINVNDAEASFPADLRETAVSLRMLTGRRFVRGQLLADILRDLADAYGIWERDGFGSMSLEMDRRMLWKGMPVRLHADGGAVEGVLAGVTSDGYLRLDTDGIERVYSSGDLSLWPAGRDHASGGKEGA